MMENFHLQGNTALCTLFKMFLKIKIPTTVCIRYFFSTREYEQLPSQNSLSSHYLLQPLSIFATDDKTYTTLFHFNISMFIKDSMNSVYLFEKSFNEVS